MKGSSVTLDGLSQFRSILISREVLNFERLVTFSVEYSPVIILVFLPLELINQVNCELSDD